MVVVLIEFRYLIASPFATGEDVTYRYFETLASPLEDRLRSFLRTLAEQLLSSGLGSVSDEAVELQGHLVITLRNLEYGRRLIESCLADHEIVIEQPAAPQRWRDYGCAEYFADGWWNPPPPYAAAEDGCILAYGEIYEDSQHDFLAIGSSFFDGIAFGYRKSQWGLWAYYPLEDYFTQKARTIAELAEGWRNGTVSV